VICKKADFSAFFFDSIMKKKEKKVINAWCMYDWANSVYSLVITTTIFPLYYSAVTRDAFGSAEVLFFGVRITNTVLYSYSLSFSFLAVAGILPLLAGIADFGGKRKRFMKFFTYLGGVSCIMLFFFTGKNIEWGIIFSVLASAGFAGSLVFYNAYLPVITTQDKYDFVSARGFSMGYLGSVILLVFNLLMITFPETFALDDKSMASRVSFLLVGMWWIGFSQITFYHLPGDSAAEAPMKKLIIKGYLEIKKVFFGLRHHINLSRFLAAFFFYNMGVQTVIYLATLFGDVELGLSANDLILTILIIQIVAIGGSYLFAKISQWKGNRVSLISMVIIWMFVCAYAYFLQSAVQFYVLGFVVGMVLGGIQSLSRASYSKLIPVRTKDTTSYFSFYDVVEKVSVVLGTLAYGMVEHITGSMRNSTLALTVFFVIGLLFLLIVRFPKTTMIDHR
jgi:UMF1 family MFS transporter